MAVVVPIISTFDSKGVTRAISDFKKLDNAGQRTQFALGTLDKGISSLGRSVAKFGGIALGVSAVIGKSLVQSASTLQESISKVEAVFGDSAVGVTSWAKTTAKSIGISQSAALEAAGTYGNLFQAFGLGQQQAQVMSVRLVELAADMASFNNTPVDEALKALSSGLSGETEPMKKYGSVLSDVRLKEEALRLKLIQTSTGTLPVAVKAQAAYSLILKDTAIQQGDVARTSDGLAFQMKSLGAQFEDVKAKIGTALLPAATRLTNYINDSMMPIMSRFAGILGSQGIGKALGYLAGEFLKATGNMGAFGNTVLALTAGIVALRLVMLAATVAQVAFNVALFANPIGIAVAAAIAFGVALVALAVKFKIVRDAFKQVFNFIVSYMQIQINIALGIAEFFVNRFIFGINLIIKAWNAIPFTSKIDELKKVNLALDITKAKITGAGSASAGSAADFRKFEEAGKATSKALTGSDTGTGTSAGVGGATKTVTDLFAKFADSARAVASDQKNLRSAIKNTADANKSLQTATDNVVAAQAKFNKVANGYGASSKEAAAAQKTLAAAQREATKAGFNLADAQNEVLEAQRRIADLNKAADPRTIQEAQDDLTQAQYALLDAEKELSDARSGGNQRAIVEAEIAVRDATNGVIDANTKLVESQKAADPALLEQAQRDLETAQLNVVEAQVAQKDSTDAVDEAQRLLNETVSGAATTSDTYKTALQQLVEAQDAEVEAIDKVRDAKEREIETTRNLAKAELLLRKAKGKLTKKQRAAADRLLDELNTPVTVTSPTPTGSTSDFSGFDFSGIDFSGFSVGGLATLAEGGIVTKPTFALIGEGGESEAVIPLSKLGGMGGDVYNITINSKIADASLPDVIVGELRKFNRRSGAINIQVA
jgi:hypothetical protein